MNKIQLSELLDKYFNGTCTPEEAEAIDQWYGQYHDGPGYTESLSGNKKDLLKAKMFDAISQQVLTDHANTAIRPIYRKWWWGAAAAAIVLICLKTFWADKPSVPVSPVHVAGLSITNHTKNIVKQLLPDSSVVWLSPNATLNWPSSFQATSRNIAMAGNCFFEVTKNPARPFIINSEHIVTKVWGTSFRVLDSKDVKAAIVTVVTGKVSVSKKGSVAASAGARLTTDEILLHPKEQVVLKNNDQLVTHKQVDVSALSLYKHIDLSFDNAKLVDIVTLLNEKFNTNIKVRNKELEKAVMTADLTGLNLPEVLEVLKASMKLDYEVSDNLIVLKRRTN